MKKRKQLFFVTSRVPLRCGSVANSKIVSGKMFFDPLTCDAFKGFSSAVQGSLDKIILEK